MKAYIKRCSICQERFNQLNAHPAIRRRRAFLQSHRRIVTDRAILAEYCHCVMNAAWRRICQRPRGLFRK
jgi:hypothetical protein